jgi:hypothetical protein
MNRPRRSELRSRLQQPPKDRSVRQVNDPRSTAVRPSGRLSVRDRTELAERAGSRPETSHRAAGPVATPVRIFLT